MFFARVKVFMSLFIADSVASVTNVVLLSVLSIFLPFTVNFLQLINICSIDLVNTT